MRFYETYAERKNRDARYKLLKSAGLSVRRTSIRNQLTHPMFIEDRKQGLSQADCGLGNSIYKTHFSVLYIVEEI